MSGDDLVPGYQYRTTRAITIQARPEQVWPWLVQVGFGRAGFYSPDLLDKLKVKVDLAPGSSLKPRARDEARADGVAL